MSRALQLSWWLPALAIATLAAVFYVAVNAGDRDIGFVSDDGVYLLMADSYWAPPGELLPVHDDITRVTHLAPGWPLLLGAVGAGIDTPERAVPVQAVLIALLAVLAGALARALGAPPSLSLLSVLLVALMPQSLLRSQGIWSEFLFVALVLAALLAATRTDRDGNNWWLLALLAGLSALVRDAGLVLILALLLHLAHRRPPRAAAIAAVALLPYLANRISHAALGGSSTYYGDLLRGLERIADGGLAAVSRIGMDLWGGTLRMLAEPQAVSWPPVVLPLLAGLVLLSALPVLVARLRRVEADAWFLVGTVLLVAIWPYRGADFASRFLYPIAPLLIIYSLLGLSRRLPSGVAALPLCVLMVPAMLAMILALLRPLPGAPPGYRHNQSVLLAGDPAVAVQRSRYLAELSRVLREAGDALPPAACVAALRTGVVVANAKRPGRQLPEPADLRAALDAGRPLSASSGCPATLAINLEADAAYPPVYPMTLLPPAAGYRYTVFEGNWRGRSEVLAVLIRDPEPGGAGVEKNALTPRSPSRQVLVSRPQWKGSGDS